MKIQANYWWGQIVAHPTKILGGHADQRCSAPPFHGQSRDLCPHRIVHTALSSVLYSSHLQCSAFDLRQNSQTCKSWRCHWLDVNN